jgi:hypothetical protein
VAQVVASPALPGTVHRRPQRQRHAGRRGAGGIATAGAAPTGLRAGCRGGFGGSGGGGSTVGVGGRGGGAVYLIAGTEIQISGLVTAYGGGGGGGDEKGGGAGGGSGGMIGLDAPVVTVAASGAVAANGGGGGEGGAAMPPRVSPAATARAPPPALRGQRRARRRQQWRRRRWRWRCGPHLRQGRADVERPRVAGTLAELSSHARSRAAPDAPIAS